MKASKAEDILLHNGEDILQFLMPNLDVVRRKDKKNAYYKSILSMEVETTSRDKGHSTVEWDIQKGIN